MNILPTMDIAATAASPYAPALALSAAVEMLASPWRESDGKPRRTISQYVAARRGKFFTLMPTMLLPRRKNDARIVKLTHWLSSVAAAAPEIPRPKVKMKIGSSTMFSSPPVTRPHIAKAECPSARSMLFITKQQHITGAPSRIHRA